MKRAKLTQKPNWPQCLEGQFGPSRFVLDYLSQNGSDRYHFDPFKIWIGPNEFYFGIFSQFGPSKSQVGLSIWPQRGAIFEIIDYSPKIVKNFDDMEVPSRLEWHKDIGIWECYKGHKPVIVKFSLDRNRHNKLSIDLLNFML